MEMHYIVTMWSCNCYEIYVISLLILEILGFCIGLTTFLAYNHTQGDTGLKYLINSWFTVTT